MESWVGSKYVAFRRGYLAPTIVLNIQKWSILRLSL